MVSEKIVSYRIEPYVQEAFVQIMWDAVFMALMILLTFMGGSICIGVSIAYVVITLLINYRVVIQAIIDKRNKDYITEIVSVEKFVDDYSFLSTRSGKKNIHFCYPKEKRVDKYKIRMFTIHNEKRKLRSVMSGRRLIKFIFLKKFGVERLRVIYLKRSKILLEIDLAEELNKKTKNKTIKRINETIYYINTQI